MIAGVQHIMLDAPLFEFFRKEFGLFDGHGADQNRLAALLGVLDQIDDGVVFFFFRPIDLVMVVFPLDRNMGRNLDHLEPVDVGEFRRFRRGGAGHA